MVATSYKIISGEGAIPRSSRIPWTLLVLNRSRHPFESGYVGELSEMGFSEIVLMDSPGSRQRSYSQIARASGAKFVVTESAVCAGEQINIGISVAGSPFVVVIWDDMRLRTLFTDSFIREVECRPSLCTVPLIHTAEDDLIPSVFVPRKGDKTVVAANITAVKIGERTLFPFDYVGIYDKKTFQRTGGYDSEIKSSYWQKMDFGFRCWMWGERIVLNPSFRLCYTGVFKPDDTAADCGYRRFFLKNLAVRVRGNSARLPWMRMLSCIVNPGIARFIEARDWVLSNSSRFVCGGGDLISCWQREGR